MRSCPTSALWERVGYLAAQPWAGDTSMALDVVRVVLLAIDEDSTGDVVALHARVAEAIGVIP